MKKLRWLIAFAVSLLWVGASFADGVGDGNFGLKGGSGSTDIYTNNVPFALTLCSAPNPPNACTDFGAGTQAGFDGKNLSGQAWSSLTVILDFAHPTTSGYGILTCDGGTFFQLSGGACGQLIPVGVTSLTLTFTQGNLSGIGCYDTNPNDASYVATCQTNSVNNLQYNATHPGQLPLPYDNWNDPGCPPAQYSGEVCGSNDFEIGVGYADGQWPTNNIPTGGTLMFNPEPPTFFLGGGAALAMLLLGLKRAKRERLALG